MRNILGMTKNFFHRNQKPIMQSILLIGYVVALIIIFVLIVNLNIAANTNDNIVSENELIKLPNDFDCILILGAGVRADGSPTPMLNDRLTVGLEAYLQKKSRTILLSGDSEHSDYTETATMRSVLIENGVDPQSIICDGYGLSTYESLVRAKEVYGYKKILIVSQKYHLHRAIYIAQELGLTAYGLDGALQGYAKQPIYNLREYLARVKDMLYAELRPEPKYTQTWEELYE